MPMVTSTSEIKCAREGSDEPGIHPHELNCESRQTGKDEVPAQHHVVVHIRLPPLQEGPGNPDERDRLVKLRRMNWHVRRRQAFRKRDSPWEAAGTSIVVADHETPDAPDRMADSECRRRRSQRS